MTKNTKTENKDLFSILKSRFEQNMARHAGIKWDSVEAKIIANPAKLKSLTSMESSGGEPDVIAYDKKTGEYLFCDCSPESPAGRRSLCYDRQGLESRKSYPPKNTACDMAEEMGVELLSEAEYQLLQTLGSFDSKSSSWLRTQVPIRKLGGAIFGDRRYDHVFIYHNGADSYYASRGFRALLRV